MRDIAVSDEIYRSITELATERGQTMEQLLADLLAQQRWEDHAVQAYDAYMASQQAQSGPQETLSDEEFLQSLKREPNADI